MGGGGGGDCGAEEPNPRCHACKGSTLAISVQRRVKGDHIVLGVRENKASAPSRETPLPVGTREALSTLGLHLGSQWTDHLPTHKLVPAGRRPQALDLGYTSAGAAQARSITH